MKLYWLPAMQVMYKVVLYSAAERYIISDLFWVCALVTCVWLVTNHMVQNDFTDWTGKFLNRQCIVTIVTVVTGAKKQVNSGCNNSI
jgi:hypothetical protein